MEFQKLQRNVKSSSYTVQANKLSDKITVILLLLMEALYILPNPSNGYLYQARRKGEGSGGSSPPN